VGGKSEGEKWSAEGEIKNGKNFGGIIDLGIVRFMAF
jgi:hypothetical protein